jgi:undecaprenyl-diphosphatase
VDSLTASIIAGLLQGLLEWLPVSSEGNMAILLTQLFGYGVEETLNTSIFLRARDIHVPQHLCLDR